MIPVLSIIILALVTLRFLVQESLLGYFCMVIATGLTITLLILVSYDVIGG